MDIDALYRPTESLFDTNRTYVPDVYHQEEMAAETDEAMPETDNLHERSIRLQHRPIVGVLFSISGGLDGELFPVYIGRNIIGSDTSCDICLREKSVSARHGSVLVRKQTDDDGTEHLQVTLSEIDSGTGLSANGKKVGFETLSCADNDVISVGRSYSLILRLFSDAFSKLSVSAEFRKMTEARGTENDGVQTSPATKVPLSSPESKPEGEDEPHDGDKAEVETAADFYKPSKPLNNDHYNNKTVLLELG